MQSHRIQELQQALNREGISAAIIMQPRDLFYYSGTAQPCNLIVPQHGEPTLLIRRGEAFVRRETWIPLCETGGSPRHVANFLKQRGIHQGVLGLELDVIPFTLIRRMEEVLDNFTVFQDMPIR